MNYNYKNTYRRLSSIMNSVSMLAPSKYSSLRHLDAETRTFINRTISDLHAASSRIKEEIDQVLFGEYNQRLPSAITVAVISLEREVEFLLDYIRENIDDSIIDEDVILTIKQKALNKVTPKSLDPLLKSLSREYSAQAYLYIRYSLIHLHLAEFFSAIKEFENAQLIVKEIVFPQEFKQSALSILNYFSEVIEEKYPEDNVVISIKQNGLRVTLTIETPEGRKEIIEQTLQQYGLVVKGELPPEKLLDNPQDILSLKHKLEMAQMEYRYAKELHSMERRQFEARVTNLENETKRLYEVLGNSIAVQKSSLLALNRVHKESSASMKEALLIIAKYVVNGSASIDNESVEMALDVVKTENSSLFSEINDLIIKGAVSGASGNYLYSWLQSLITALPK